MALGYDRPSDGLLRELSAVARRASAFETALSTNTNSPPEALPLVQLSEILAVLKGLPGGTAEGGRLQLETADSRLNEIRIEFFSLLDVSADDPGYMRDVPLDDALSLLIAAVRTALSAANRESGKRDTPPDQARSTNRSKAEDELAAASQNAGDTVEALSRAHQDGMDLLDPGSARVDILLRRLNDAKGLVRQARVELQWKEIVTAWIRRLADALAKTPDLIRSAADVIDTSCDIVGLFYDQWKKFHEDLERLVRTNLPAFTRNLRLAADRLERRIANESVLFVDDEEPARVFAGSALRTAYRSVDTAESGSDALELAKTKHFDVLITDVVMPDIGGLALAAEFKKRHPAIAVLLVSGYAEQAIQREIKNHGFDFLPKPYSLDQLTLAVERVIKRGESG